MQIKIKGEMPITDIKHAIIEKLNEIEEDFAVRYSRGATLYINPTNGFGDDVVPRKNGKPLDKLYSSGPYRSAADSYDP